jgi:hypothetical protein
MPALIEATPEPARSIVRALADGRAPRAMLLGGEVDPLLLDEVLSDLASRGAVQAVWAHSGEEVMAREVEALLAPREPAVRAAPVLVSSRPAPIEPPRPASTPEAELLPSSLADAVMRELSEPAPAPRPSSSRPPIVQPGELRPRPPQAPAPFMVGMTPIPPDAVVPASEEGDLTEIDAPIGPAADARLAEPSIPIEVGSMVSAPVAPKEIPELPSRTPMASVASEDPDARSPRRTSKSRWPWVVAITLVGGVVLLGLQAANPSSPSEPSAAAARAPEPVVLPPPARRAPVVAEPAASADAGHGARAALVTP